MWSKQQLRAMLEERNTQWLLACEDETTIPPFVRSIRNYATRLQVVMGPQILFVLHGIAHRLSKLLYTAESEGHCSINN